MLGGEGVLTKHETINAMSPHIHVSSHPCPCTSMSLHIDVHIQMLANMIQPRLTIGVKAFLLTVKGREADAHVICQAAHKDAFNLWA